MHLRQPSEVDVPKALVPRHTQSRAAKGSQDVCFGGGRRGELWEMIVGYRDRGASSDVIRGVVHCCGVGGRHVVSGGREIVLRGSNPIPIDVRLCVAVG